MMLSRDGNSAAVNRLRLEVRLNNAKRERASFLFARQQQPMEEKKYLKINFSISLLLNRHEGNTLKIER